jgi:Na+-transporting methylmalonyl-CoA/oxaloacetate decarboxylase gamma subunit
MLRVKHRLITGMGLVLLWLALPALAADTFGEFLSRYASG